MKAFNGLNHNFIVTFGRISYAAAPDWITDEESRQNMSGMIGKRVHCDHANISNYFTRLIIEMAVDLLALVVDGPEGDSLWSMYQGGAQSGMIDEEEMELEVTG